jgi:hypothetical protein
MTGDNTSRRCDLCGESFTIPGGYGSGALADGLYCSQTCYALSRDRYAPPLADMIDREGDADEHEPPD